MSKDTSIDLNSKFAPKQQEQPQKQQQTSKAVVNWNEVFTEWCYKIPKGYPTIVDGVFTEYEEVKILNEILEEKFGESMPLPLEAKAPKSTTPQVQGSNTPVVKEGLAVYFATQTDKLLNKALTKCNNPADTTLLNFNTSTITPQYYGKGHTMVIDAIEVLNTKSVGVNAILFKNALSIAFYIHKTHGQLKQSIIDRGILYDKIRKHAVDLIKTKYELPADEDKWCPADIYIYNDIKAATNATIAKELNIGERSLNNMFNPQFDTNGGIVGISLKEGAAQAGKASSFNAVLTRKENYQNAAKLAKDQKATLELLYNLNQVVGKESKKLTPKMRIGYVAEALRIMETKQIGDPQLKRALIAMLKKTFGTKMSMIMSKKGLYDKNAARSVFDQLKVASLPTNDSLVKLVRSYDESVKKDALKVYQNSRKAFIDTLKRLKYTVPTKSPDIKLMGSETLYKKANCYLVANDLLAGLDANALQIPAGYTSLIQQKNAFVALTAYAIGMAGVSPTFFKLVGDPKGVNAHMEPFYGNGFLSLDEGQQTTIVDTTEYKGFYVTFYTKVKLSEKKSAKTMGAYKVTLDFRYAGDQLNIEVSELKPA
jgi:hypothetical protein